jgi:hypothetical protein
MRSCPFCSAENADDLAVCQACGRRLPPLPPRRGSVRNAPPTGIQLPNRPAGSTLPPRKPGSTMSPPITTQPYPVLPVPGTDAAPVIGPTTGTPAYAPSGASGPVTGSPVITPPITPPIVDDSARRELANALNPGPAAQRREATPDDRIPADRRTRADSRQPVSPMPLARPHSPSQPPPTPATTPPATYSPAITQPGFGAPARRPQTAPPPIPKTGPHAALPAPPPTFDGDTFVSDNDYSKLPAPAPAPSEAPMIRPRSEAMIDRAFSSPRVLPVPLVPEPGLVKAAIYAYEFARARWQRRGAIRVLGQEIKQDTESLDQVLGALGLAARTAGVEGRVFSAENSAISEAQERINQLQREGADVEARRAEELAKFVEIERERNAKLTEAERMVGEAQSELSNLEAQRRSLRDKRKELDRRLKAYLKAADDHDRQAGSSPLGDQRQELRRVAESHRKEAAALEPDKQEIDRSLGGIERPINEVTARLDAGKAELDAAKRSLNDAREGHNHRLAELDSEQKRKTREIGLAESEISRRLVTLGTLVNLNRIEDPRFAELYARIDHLRSAITSRTTEQEKLTAEREAYDRGTLVRGVATIGGAILILIALIVIVAAIL